MTLNQLRAFLATMRLGSFTAAAASLGVAQASVSELVRRLEDEYGVPLFTRGGRQLVATSAGQALVPFAEQAVRAVANGEEALRALRTLTGGVATFGLLRNADYYFLSDLLERFHRAHPDVRVRLVGQNSVEVAAGVRAGELEAGLVVLPVNDEGLEVTPLARDEVLYASADQSRVAQPVTIESIAAAKLILYDAHYGWEEPTRRQLRERAQQHGLHLEPMIEVEHVESALSLVARGIGDTIISSAVAESPACPPEIGTASLAEPIYDVIARIQREGALLSPATWEILRLAQAMLIGRNGGKG